MELIIYEGTMCCSSGVCGPEPDKELIELNEALKRLQAEFKGLTVTRASISFNPNIFLKNEEISRLVKENGMDILPLTTFNGRIVEKGKYPSYDEIKTLLLEGSND